MLNLPLLKYLHKNINILKNILTQIFGKNRNYAIWQSNDLKPEWML